MILPRSQTSIITWLCSESWQNVQSKTKHWSCQTISTKANRNRLNQLLSFDSFRSCCVSTICCWKKGKYTQNHINICNKNPSTKYKNDVMPLLIWIVTLISLYWPHTPFWSNICRLFTTVLTSTQSAKHVNIWVLASEHTPFPTHYAEDMIKQQCLMLLTASHVLSTVSMAGAQLKSNWGRSCEI